ncbi:nucleoside deaminase [Candidatus Dependentiae bacterium]|nr:nucleoside deaminase [Candidatus Dependentiae bacterium]
MQELANNDVFFMNRALSEARRAAQENEVPIGAVIVDPTGTIIARAHNQVEHQQCQLAHAELLAIKQACAHLGDWRLNNHWIYVTLEPCSMCVFALVQSRIAGIVYGAESPLFGFHLDIQDGLAVYKKTTIVKGVCSQESENLLKDFFIKKRNAQRE